MLNKIFTPSFYAREDMRSPMWFAGINAAVNVAGSLILFPVVGVMGVAVATSIAGWVNVALLGGVLYRDGRFSPTRLTMRRIALIIAASALLGLALYLALRVIGPVLMDGPILIRLGLMLLLIAGGALIYFAFVLLTGAMDRRQLLSLVSRKRN